VTSLLSYLLPAYSAWILVFVSFERLVMILFSTKKIAKLFKNIKFLIACLLGILLIGIFYYTPTWLNSTIVYYEYVNESYVSY